MAFSYLVTYTGDCSGTSSGVFNLELGIGPTTSVQITWLSPQYLIPESRFITYAGKPTTYRLENLNPEFYSFTLFDPSDGQQYAQQFTLTTGTTGTIITVDNTTCNLNNGGVLVQANNFGTNVLTYSLYDAVFGFRSSVQTIDQFANFNNLPASVYYITIDDGTGCIGETPSFIIKESVPIDYGFYVVNDSSCITNSGKIYVTGLTGVAPFTYLWNDGSTNSSLIDLNAGNYNVTVRDSANCFLNKGVVVGTVGQLGLGSIISIPPSCSANDGEVTVTITGGTTPYYYSASTGEVKISFSDTETFYNIPSGNFSIEVTDAALCKFNTSTNVFIPGAITVGNINVINPDCTIPTGSIEVFLFGSSGPYTYSLTGGTISQTFTTSSSSYVFTNITSGNYTLFVGGGGCTYSYPITVSANTLFDFSFTTTGTTCLGTDGIVKIELI